MTHTPTSIMLFGAGFGTRMGPLTKNQPKPMVPVSNRPLIDHALDLVHSHGGLNAVLNLHYKPESLIAHLANRDITLLHETPDILDTGGGLKNALTHLGPNPVFTLNTDAIWNGPNPLTCLANAWEPDHMEALLLLVPKPRAMGHAGQGSFQLTENNRLSWHPDLIYTGAQITKTGGLNDIDKTAFSLRELWTDMINRGTAYGVTYPGRWCDVGQPSSIPIAEALLNDV